ncbi:hypothetical protein AYO38_11940 [bacterium SCGC AG-212-C10]|nr:hypothetical protein AYO38_11940 [bacterium SCGC AG-212-C10]
MDSNHAVRIGATAISAVIAAIATAVLEGQMIDSFLDGPDAGVLWGQTVFILLVPAMFGGAALVLGGSSSHWFPLLFISAFASAAMAIVAGRELVPDSDISSTDLQAIRAWYGVLYFCGGMLVPLAVTIGRLRPAS